MFLYFHLQAEIENLSMEERSLDDRIRFTSCHSLIIILLCNGMQYHCIFYILVLQQHCRQMQEKLRDLSEDENNQR